jgi:hypothetical protein
LGLTNLHLKPSTHPPKAITNLLTLRMMEVGTLIFTPNMMKLVYEELMKTKFTHQVATMEQLF